MPITVHAVKPDQVDIEDELVERLLGLRRFDANLAGREHIMRRKPHPALSAADIIPFEDYAFSDVLLNGRRLHLVA